MEDAQRKPFIDRAKQNKAQSKGQREVLCCTGVPLSQVQREKDEKNNREIQIKHNIETAVKISIREEKFSTQSYYFLAVNYFAKTLRGGIYVPAEISIAEFTLQDGVIRSYHTLVNPGVTLYGHQYDAQVHSEETHKLPIPPRAIGDTNLGRVYNDLLKFIINQETGEYPPVYTMSDGIGIAESILQFMKSDDGTEDIRFDIYPIQYLFYIMKEAACKIGEIEDPNIFLTNSFFDRDYFEYHIGLACEYHEDIDRSKYCTQSMVIRWGYMFCDYICNDVAIILAPGRHIPTEKGAQLTVTQAPVSKKKKIHTHYHNACRSHLDPGVDKKALIDSSSIDLDRKPENILLNSDFPSLGGIRQPKSRVISPPNNSVQVGQGNRFWSNCLQIPAQPKADDFIVRVEKIELDPSSELRSSGGNGRGRRGRGRGRGRLYVPFDSNLPQF